ncbi:hypothetical protein BDF19DRAFT_428979 [Syncephalis fuscata]|nr:hypothetical protein BDF19DRAFT_428979 [Syncephalis fuscata]
MHSKMLGQWIFFYFLMQLNTVFAWITLQSYNASGSQSLTLHTRDPHETYMDFFNITGIIVPVSFVENDGCKLEKMLPYDANNKTISLPNNIQASIAVIDMGQAERYNCRDQHELYVAILNYNEWLISQAFPPIKLAVHITMLTQFDSSVTPGGRALGKHYNYFSRFPPNHLVAVISVSDQMPSKILWHKYNRLLSVQLFAVKHGKWNDALYSTWYRTIIWIYFFFTLLFVIYGIYDIIFIIMYGSFKSKLHAAAFILALLAAIGSLAILPLTDTDLTVLTIAQVFALFRTLSFYFLMLIWVQFYIAVEKQQTMVVLRYILHIGAAILTSAQLAKIVGNFLVDITNIYVKFFMVAANIVVYLGLFVAFMILYCSFVFYATMKHCKNRLLRRALTRLSILTLLLFMATLLVFIDKALCLNENWLFDINIVMARKVIRNTGFTLQSIGLICMLGVRMPDGSVETLNSACTKFNKMWANIQNKLFRVPATTQVTTAKSNNKHEQLANAMNQELTEQYSCYPSSAIQSSSSRVPFNYSILIDVDESYKSKE